jgi:hypothetical protein
MRILLTLVTLLTSACSYVFVVPPETRSLAGTPSTCSTSQAAPVVDTLVAIGAIVVAAAALSDCEGECIGAVMTVPAAVLISVPFAFSAGHGFDATHECRVAQPR